ncbi:hypothetical protein PENTCL1PPCAC_21894, partial [Pristionchus entomophagus]
RANVFFDLKKGIDTFIDKCDSETMKNEGGLHPLCAWAYAEEGDDLKQIFSGAKFAGRRGTIKNIAIAIWSHNTKFEVVKFTEIPKKEAMDLLTPEFKKKFNLGD